MKTNRNERLQHAVQINNVAEARKLLSKDNVNSILDGYSLLHWAAQEGYIEIAKVLITVGADLNIKDDCGFSPLHKAVGENQVDLVRLLINNGADVDVLDETCSTPLFIACSYGIETMVNLLIGSKATINVYDSYGNSPIVYAVIYGHFEIVKTLINKGADISIEGVDVDEEECKKLKLSEIAQNHNYMDIYSLLEE